MPIYEYACHKCGETIEVIQKMSDPDLQKHQGCGGKLNKLISIPMVQFKESEPGMGKPTDSYRQQLENEAKRREKKNKPKSVISAPRKSKKS